MLFVTEFVLFLKESKNLAVELEMCILGNIIWVFRLIIKIVLSFSCANVKIDGGQFPNQTMPFYRSYDQNGSLKVRESYKQNERANWIEQDGIWYLPLFTNATETTTAYMTTTPAPPPITSIDWWKNLGIPGLVIGICVVVIIVATILFICWRKKRRAKMAAPVAKVIDFSKIDEDEAFDDVF